MRRTLLTLGTAAALVAGPAATATATPAPGHVPAKAAPIRVIPAARDSAFVTPSGGITCYLAAAGRGRTTTRCEILNHRWRIRKPASCPVDYGDGFTLGRRGSAVLCAGDTIAFTPQLGSGTTAWFRSTRDVRVRVHGMPLAGLRYGYALRVGDTTCTSTVAGVTCANTAKHGFFLSRESYRTW